MSSNSGANGAITKSSAPVINTVRWPSARWWRTRRMAAGNDWRSSKSLNISKLSSATWSTGAPAKRR